MSCDDGGVLWKWSEWTWSNYARPVFAGRYWQRRAEWVRMRANRSRGR